MLKHGLFTAFSRLLEQVQISQKNGLKFLTLVKRRRVGGGEGRGGEGRGGKVHERGSGNSLSTLPYAREYNYLSKKT